MPVIVTVWPQEPSVTLFEVENYVLPRVFEDFLDAALRKEIDADQVYVVNLDDDNVVLNHDKDLPREWYIKVIDAVKDCVGDEHEVLSRLSTWP